MKNIRCLAILLVLLCAPAWAFAKKASVKVVTTIFPQYDWTREILGSSANGVELTLLAANGTDLHSYQPSIQDMAKIASADIFIYVGGESDGWVDKALSNATNKNMTVLNLMELLGDRAKEEELKEGMQAEEEDADEEEEEYDEHVWLSLRNAQLFCTAICDALCRKLPANESAYRENTAAYCSRLDALDRQYAGMVRGAKRQVLLFADRFPFRYLTDDYGIDYYAAFKGCSAETEASFKTIVFLAQKMDELSLPCTVIIETGDGKIARTIISTSKTKTAAVLTLDSMQATTLRQAKAGTSYIGIMQKNYEVLREALN